MSKGTKNTLSEEEEAQEILDSLTTDEFKIELNSMFKSKYPLMYMVTQEEKRMIEFMKYYCQSRQYELYAWDCCNGLINVRTMQGEVASDDIKNPLMILDHILEQSHKMSTESARHEVLQGRNCQGIAFMLLDFHRYLENHTPLIERRLKLIAEITCGITTILTGPSYETTPAIDNLMTRIDFPYPNEKEIKSALWSVVDPVSTKLEKISSETRDIEEDLINSVKGLTINEAQSAFAKSLVTHRGWDMKTILSEKKNIIRKNGLLDYYDQKYTMNDIGGLHNVVDWMKRRKHCFSDEAREFGLKSPKGVLFVGTPGGGKSLVCKAVSHMWNMPLLRLDFGRLFGSLVGQSEESARKAIQLAEVVSPSILWIDEIDKALSGASGSERSDGGTTKRVLSTFLTWMQEKESSVFVVATANDHKSIPPEFQRAGRFDEVFFVDLPNTLERTEIFSALLSRKKYDPSDFDLNKLASVTENYTGAEIEKCIDDGMLTAFEDDKRQLTDDDIIDASGRFYPLWKMRQEEIEEMREWAKNHCISASYKEDKKHSVPGQSNGRELEL